MPPPMSLPAQLRSAASPPPTAPRRAGPDRSGSPRPRPCTAQGCNSPRGGFAAGSTRTGAICGEVAEPG
eukprot:11035324-Alexandrium_andersonii.AAC.1